MKFHELLSIVEDLENGKTILDDDTTIDKMGKSVIVTVKIQLTLDHKNDKKLLDRN